MFVSRHQTSTNKPCNLTAFWTAELHRLTTRTLLAAGMIVATGIASAQAAPQSATISDAQVESNVLKALASAPELASEAITTKTVYGTVTLSGTVQSETLRRRAEVLASNANGVKKVIDQLTLGDTATASAQPGSAAPGPNMVLQSDGTYAPADQPQYQTPTAEAQSGTTPIQPQRNNPDADQELDRQMEAQQQAQQNNQQTNNQQQTTATTRRPINSQPYPPNSYPQQAQNYPPQYPQQYPNQQYPQQYPQSQPGYATHGYAAPVDGGQQAGLPVTIPADTLIRVRVNQNLSSDHSQPGTPFDGIVVNDVVAGNVIAIPRGAAIRGIVVDAKPSGALKGRGEMTLQLNQLTLAGRSYPIVSDSWAHNGGDKTIETVNKTLGFGALGAIIGAVAGGGTGAAIGGGVGAAAGLGSSAASGRGQVYIPSEAVVTFHLAQPANVQTVSEQEMQRLAYGVAPGADQRYARRAYPRPYYAPYPNYPPPY